MANHPMPNRRRRFVLFMVMAFVVLFGSMMIGSLLNEGRSARRAANTNFPDAAATDSAREAEFPSSMPLVLPPNTPLIFFMTSDSSTDYIAEYNLSIDQKQQTLLRYIPSLDVLDKLSDWESYSFAQVSMQPYTVDGRLFIVKYDTTYEHSDDHHFEEYQPTISLMFQQAHHHKAKGRFSFREVTVKIALDTWMPATATCTTCFTTILGKA